jgi:hypothetical protein
MIGRKKPYSERGINRVPCARCGKPSQHQWNCCALDNRWLGVCTECDIKLNADTLAFFRVPDAAGVLAAYVERML